MVPGPHLIPLCQLPSYHSTSADPTVRRRWPWRSHLSARVTLHKGADAVQAPQRRCARTHARTNALTHEQTHAHARTHTNTHTHTHTVAANMLAHSQGIRMQGGEEDRTRRKGVEETGGGGMVWNVEERVPISPLPSWLSDWCLATNQSRVKSTARSMRGQVFFDRGWSLLCRYWRVCACVSVCLSVCLSVSHTHIKDTHD